MLGKVYSSTRARAIKRLVCGLCVRSDLTYAVFYINNRNFESGCGRQDEDSGNGNALCKYLVFARYLVKRHVSLRRNVSPEGV